MPRSTPSSRSSPGAAASPDAASSSGAAASPSAVQLPEEQRHQQQAALQQMMQAYSMYPGMSEMLQQYMVMANGTPATGKETESHRVSFA